MATTTENYKELNRRVVEDAFNTGNLALLDELMAPEVAGHLKRDIGALRQAFPDLHYTIEQVVGENEFVTVRVTITGTNSGSFQGRPPTGKAVSFTAMVMSRCAGSKIVEQWLNIDQMSLMKQLGVVPSGIPAHASGIARDN